MFMSMLAGMFWRKNWVVDQSNRPLAMFKFID